MGPRHDQVPQGADPVALIESPFLIAGIALGTLGAILVLTGLAALFRGRILRFAFRLLSGLILASLGAASAAVAVGMYGYSALTREEVAARVIVAPAAELQRFTATITFPDGRRVTLDLAGDQIYFDAHILKWKPFAHFLGLHTAYELDRMSGRYYAIEQERTAPRTVHSLARDKPLDLFSLRQRHAFLEPLLDAEYGSATYVPVKGPAELELRVSTTGLLVRPVKPPG